LAAGLRPSRRFARLLFCHIPTTHDLIFVSVLLANAIPAVHGSLTLAGNFAYIWCFRPHADDEKGVSAPHARSESMTSAQP